jgi:hypothetical protein
MGINIKQYGEFLNESMDVKTAIQNLVEMIQKSAGWIDPKIAIDLFVEMTGLEEEDFEVDKMLGTLMDLDLLYYEDKTVSNHKGKRVEIGEPYLTEYPERSTDNGRYPGAMESLNFKIKKLDEFH